MLTFNDISYIGEARRRWNCTDVYQRTAGRWQIIQTHWSYIQPFGQADDREAL